MLHAGGIVTTSAGVTQGAELAWAKRVCATLVTDPEMLDGGPLRAFSVRLVHGFMDVD